MEYIGLVEKGNRYKGNLHSHTTVSDGKMSPIEGVKAYKEQGYHFAAFTDHEIYMDWRELIKEDGFALLPGIEISAYLTTEKKDIFDAYATHHILGILGTKEMQNAATLPIFNHGDKVEVPIYAEQWDSTAVAQNMVDSLVNRGFLAVYNHPLWSRVSFDDWKNIKNLWAMETYNHNSEISDGVGTDFIHWDDFLTNKGRLLSIATDDNHNGGPYEDSFGGYIVVLAEALTHESLLQNMIEENYYSSTGVDIHHWGIKDNKVYVECSHVHSIHFIVGDKIGGGKKVYSGGLEETICYGEYELRGSESYIRIICTDKYGRQGWTNPYFFTKE